MMPTLPTHRQSRHGSGSGRQWTLAWIIGTGLLTGCQTFNYTEADFARERGRIAAWAAGPHGLWGGHAPRGGSFGRLSVNVGDICPTPAGSFGAGGK